MRKTKTFHNPLEERLGKDFFATLPKTPGVYFMRSADGEILYVGKATNLRNRVSSYKRAKPGKVGRNIVKLLGYVDSITWEEHESEQRAYERELAIIRALVPRYNIADAWEEDYFFVGLRLNRRNELEFRLTSSEDVQDERFELHGCFPQRRLIKQGYAALLRILYAATCTSNARFSFPAKLARPSPCYRYTLKLEEGQKWKNLISTFLHGEDSKLLSNLMNALLLSSVVPEYARPALQRDFDRLKAFDEACLATRRSLNLKSGEVTSHKSLRRAIRDSLEP